ncbi:MAG TPA: serine/threonine-protein kinase [Kofleriaceae bacterium]|nr:serine/threonine-protein kinase [Kofleriaceae bacterium]
MGLAGAGSGGSERRSTPPSQPPHPSKDDSLDETLPSGEHMVDPDTRAAIGAAVGTPTGFRTVPSAGVPTPIPAAIQIPAEPPAAPLEVAPGAAIGRYVVEQQLGSGTMGLVLAAIDPALDRKVALKVVRPDQIGGSTAGRQRLLREAQAMAKLAHPNVVTVYEVGTFADHVFVAMEHVAGTTLDQWVRDTRPTLREIVDAFSAAGRGLAAAHAAGIVHRDFKPANVLISADGRVRVADFGLATTPVTPPDPAPRAITGPLAKTLSITQTGALLGTPAYMSPEQHQARPADARADQFSFCVAMYEALYGQLPFAGEGYLAYAENVLQGAVREPPRGNRVPGRIRRILLRGLSVEPDRRYPGLRALLADLDRAMTAPRRRLALAGVTTLGAGALAFALLGPHAGGGEDRCASADQPAASLWDAGSRGKVEAALTSAGIADAAGVFARIDAAMNARVARIRSMRREACVATEVDRAESPLLMARRMRCLDRRGDEVNAFAAIYGGDRERTVLDRALQAALTLPPVDQCGDKDALLAAVAPPDDPAVRARVDELDRRIARAAALESAGKLADAGKEAQAVVAEADKLAGYPPIRARAHFNAAEILSSLDEYEKTVAELRVAAELAGAAKDDELLARTWILLYATIGYHQSKPAEARPLDQVAAAAVERAGKSAELLGALENARGAIALGSGDYVVSSEHFLAAVKHYTAAFGPDSPKVADNLTNAGMALEGVPRYPEAKETLEKALAIKTRVFGPDHLEVARALKALGGLLDTMEKREESLAAFTRALGILEKTLPPDHQSLGNTASSVGVVLDNLDRSQEALPYHLRAIAILEKKPKDNQLALSYALSNLGVSYMETERYREAFEVYERALAIKEATVGKDHPAVGHTLCQMGTAARRMGDLAKAQGFCKRALSVLEKKLGRDHPDCAGPLGSLAEIALDRGQAAQALPLVERVREIARKAGESEESAGFGETLFLHGRVLVALRRAPEGLALMGRGLDLMKTHGSKKKVIAEAESQLARARKH